jgi:hypothetical protein
LFFIFFCVFVSFPLYIFRNIDKIRANNELVYESRKVTYNSSQQLSSIDIHITTPELFEKHLATKLLDPAGFIGGVGYCTSTDIGTCTDKSTGTGTNLSSVPNPIATGQLVPAAKKVWSEIQNNKKDVFLHVLLICRSVMNRNRIAAQDEKLDSRSRNGKEDDDDVSYSPVVSAKMIKEGAALHGVVRLIKYDRVPFHFRKRYLLSDFGIGPPVSNNEGMLGLFVCF